MGEKMDKTCNLKMYTITIFVDKLKVEGMVSALIRVVYFYAISFITLMMLIGGSVTFFMETANFVKPAPYLMTKVDYGNDGAPIKNKNQTYEQYVSESRSTARDQALNSMIKSLGWILIPGAVYVFVNRRIHRMED
jgi:hypothetical protein